jgi:hypothetical protein
MKGKRAFLDTVMWYDGNSSFPRPFVPNVMTVRDEMNMEERQN